MGTGIYVGTLFSTAYLEHHGILGMKWGVRRYQNEDGSLTEIGKRRHAREQKKAVKRYKKESINVQKEQLRNRQRLYVNAYNKTVDEYNNGKIAEYNKKHKVTDKDYESGYEEQFSRDFKRNLNRAVMDFTLSSPAYKRGVALANKYRLWEIDELARQNKQFVDEMLASDYTLDVNEFEKRASRKS